MRRFLAILVAATIGFGLVGATASAKTNSTSVFHFKGRAGSAVLTNCSPSDPVGTTCRAVEVFAFMQRVNADGVRSGGPTLGVTLFDVTLTATEPFFEAVPIGAGFTNVATVRIASNLSRGMATAGNVPLCDSFPCAPGDPTSLAIHVEWVGVGTLSKFKFHDKFSDPFCFVNSHSKGTFRAAEATGRLDGEVVVVPELPGFQATLQSDKFGSVQRCSLT